MLLGFLRFGGSFGCITTSFVCIVLLQHASVPLLRDMRIYAKIPFPAALGRWYARPDRCLSLPSCFFARLVDPSMLIHILAGTCQRVFHDCERTTSSSRTSSPRKTILHVCNPRHLDSLPLIIISSSPNNSEETGLRNQVPIIHTTTHNTSIYHGDRDGGPTPCRSRKGPNQV